MRKIKRKAIKTKDIIRVSIIDPKKLLLERCKEKLEYLNNVGDATQDEVLEVAYYYSYKVRELYGLTGFNAISKKDPINHRNWKHFANVCKLCIKNNWDTFIYIDSQFDRAEYWENSDGRIYPPQLYSVRATAHYHKYIKEKTQEHEADGTDFKASSIRTLEEEILKEVKEDCYLIKNGIEFLNVEGTNTEKKVIVLVNNCLSLSPYYISNCTWLLEVIKDQYSSEDYPGLKKVLKKVDLIDSNKKLKEKIKNIIIKFEKKFNIPETPSKETLIDFLK